MEKNKTHRVRAAINSVRRAPEQSTFPLLITAGFFVILSAAYLIFRLGRASLEYEKWADYRDCGV